MLSNVKEKLYLTDVTILMLYGEEDKIFISKNTNTSNSDETQNEDKFQLPSYFLPAILKYYNNLKREFNYIEFSFNMDSVESTIELRKDSDDNLLLTFNSSEKVDITIYKDEIDLVRLIINDIP